MAAPYRFLLLEPMHAAGTRLLADRGEVIVAPSVDEVTLRPLLRDADAVVIRATGTLTRSLLEAAPRLKVIGRHGVGLETIDLAAATELGIRVVYTPEGNAESVAEHFFSMALALSKRLLEADRALREGRWQVRHVYYGQELRGKTLGVVGFGRIGRATARIGHHGFAMPILYHDLAAAPSVLEAELGARRADLTTVLREADYISLNLPLTPRTRHLVGQDEFHLMKPSAYVLNLGRGPLWDEGALLEALTLGQLAGAATDVFEAEPTSADNPLLRLPNFICTPHMSSHTDEAMRRMSLVAEDVLAVLEGRAPRWPAN